MEVAVTEVGVMISSRVIIRMMGNTIDRRYWDRPHDQRSHLFLLTAGNFDRFSGYVDRATEYSVAQGPPPGHPEGSLRCLHVSFPRKIPGTNST
eukprot:scaffold8447_cov66-Cyclotella_meneghiniana.AAC.12